MKPYVMEKLKDLTDENLNQKIADLINEIGTTNFVNSNQSDLMFILHNRAFPNQQEHTNSCGSCRERVYNRLNAYAKTNNTI